MLITYKGKSAFTVEERGHRFVVDQPTDKGGGDEGPTPTELFIASLGTCMGLYVARFCEARKIPSEGMQIELLYQRAQNPPRIASVSARIKFPHKVPEERKEALIKSAESCFIHNTLKEKPTIKIMLE